MVDDLCQQQNPLMPFSAATVIYDWTAISMYTGHCLSEWAQHDHVTTLANKVALTPDGDPITFMIHDHGRHPLHLSHALAHIPDIVTATIHWHQQKNKCKDKKKFLVCTPVALVLCAISALTCIIQQWLDLHLPPTYPLALFTNGLPTGTITFIQAQHITTAFWASAQCVYAIVNESALKQWMTHSSRIGACVCLHAAGINTETIQHTSIGSPWPSNNIFGTSLPLPITAQSQSALSTPTALTSY